jgi:hypothetical protein
MQARVIQYRRVVGDDETIHEALLDAIQNGCYLWTDQAGHAVICKKQPRGFLKVHATYQLPDFAKETA